MIAEAIHPTGAVAIWSCGTNRVIEACERYGIDSPTFEEQDAAGFGTFGAEIGPGAGARHQVGTRSALSRHQVIRPLVGVGLLEMTIPEKPISSRQRYRTTAVGVRLIEDRI